MFSHERSDNGPTGRLDQRCTEFGMEEKEASKCFSELLFRTVLFYVQSEVTDAFKMCSFAVLKK